MRCAFGAHLDVGLPERPTPCRFVGNLAFPSLFLEEDGRLYKTEPLVMMPCGALSLLPSRLSFLTRRSCLYRMQIEHMTRRSCRRDGAARRDTLSLVPSRRRCPTRRNCVNCMPMEPMVRWSCPRSCPTRQSCQTRMGSVVSPPYNQSGGV